MNFGHAVITIVIHENSHSFHENETLTKLITLPKTNHLVSKFNHKDSSRDFHDTKSSTKFIHTEEFCSSQDDNDSIRNCHADHKCNPSYTCLSTLITTKTKKVFAIFITEPELSQNSRDFSTKLGISNRIDTCLLSLSAFIMAKA